MAEFSFAGAFALGFQLLLRRPVSSLVWGLLSAVISLAVFHPHAHSASLPGIVGRSASLAHNLSGFLGSAASWFAADAWTTFSFLAGAAVRSVLACAVCRAILRPRDRSFAYLRLGRAESYVWLLSVVVGFVYWAASAAAVALFGTPSGTALSLMAYGLAIPGSYFAILVLAAYPYARLSLVGAMIVSDNRFHLLESWRMTEGKVWRLVGLAVLVFVVSAILPTAKELTERQAGYFLQTGGSLQNLMTHPTVPLIVSSLLNVPISAFTLAVGTAPWATVYRDLSAAPDYAEVFA